MSSQMCPFIVSGHDPCPLGVHTQTVGGENSPVLQVKGKLAFTEGLSVPGTRSGVSRHCQTYSHGNSARARWASSFLMWKLGLREVK